MSVFHTTVLLIMLSIVVVHGRCEGTTCEVCVKIPACGWCTLPVRYTNGTVGTNCVSYPVDPSVPRFRCFGRYYNSMCPSDSAPVTDGEL